MATDPIYEFAKELDFIVRTEKGVRTFGPHRLLVKHAPQKGCDVFVDRLPTDAYEKEIYIFFARVGHIFKIRLFLNMSRSTKGYGYVTFFTAEEAAKAVEVLRKAEFRQCHFLYMEIGGGSKTLLVTGTSATPEEVKQNVAAVVMGLTRVSTVDSVFRNFLLEFSHCHEADLALYKLRKVAKALWGPAATITWQSHDDDDLHGDKENRNLQVPKCHMSNPDADTSHDLKMLSLLDLHLKMEANTPLPAFTRLALNNLGCNGQSTSSTSQPSGSGTKPGTGLYSIWNPTVNFDFLVRPSSSAVEDLSQGVTTPPTSEVASTSKPSLNPDKHKDFSGLANVQSHDDNSMQGNDLSAMLEEYLKQVDDPTKAQENYDIQDFILDLLN